MAAGAADRELRRRQCIQITTWFPAFVVWKCCIVAYMLDFIYSKPYKILLFHYICFISNLWHCLLVLLYSLLGGKLALHIFYLYLAIFRSITFQGWRVILAIFKLHLVVSSLHHIFYSQYNFSFSLKGLGQSRIFKKRILLCSKPQSMLGS